MTKCERNVFIWYSLQFLRGMCETYCLITDSYMLLTADAINLIDKSSWRCLKLHLPLDQSTVLWLSTVLFMASCKLLQHTAQTWYPAFLHSLRFIECIVTKHNVHLSYVPLTEHVFKSLAERSPCVQTNFTASAPVRAVKSLFSR